MRSMPLTARACLIVIALAACGEAAAPAGAPAPVQPAESSAAGLPDRDPALARRLVQQEGALLLDVRTQGEFDGGHVEGASLIPYDQLSERINEVVKLVGGDRSKPIVVYCRSGRRSGIAKQTLLDAGFERVTNLGGLTDWCDDC